MRRVLESTLLLSILVLSLAAINASCSHRGSDLDGPVVQAWAAHVKGPGDDFTAGNAIALDSLGNICVVGTTGTAEDNTLDILIAKYDGSGKRLWLATYDGPAGGADQAAGLAIDAEGHIYVAGMTTIGMTTIEEGYYTSPGEAQAVIIKYDCSGNQLWVATHEGKAGGSWGRRAMVPDDAGNVYLTGSVNDAEGYGVFFTVKYDSNGKQLWDSHYRWPESGDAAAVAIALDKQGSVCVTGSASNTRTAPPEEWKSAIITVKYDSAGEELWAAEYDSGVRVFHGVSDMAIDGQGNVCITGRGGWTAGDYLTIKYDPNGKQLWVARYNGPGKSADEARALCVDDLGNIFVTGSSFGAGTGYDCATVKYDKDGNEVWVARYDGPGHYGDGCAAIAVDGSGNSYVTGGSHHAGPEDVDCYTIKYDAEGNQVWAARYYGPASFKDYATDVVVNDSGNVYVTGRSMYLDVNSVDSCCLIIKYVPA